MSIIFVSILCHVFIIIRVDGICLKLTYPSFTGHMIGISSYVFEICYWKSIIMHFTWRVMLLCQNRRVKDQR